MDINNIIAKMRKPALYEKSPYPFWEDDYISKGMLAAHLNPNTDAASRNPAFLDRSAEWISKLLPPTEYTELLDLGCGPGLYAQRFARKGYAVTGVDFSERSLDYARKAAEIEKLNIKYCQADYLNLDLKKQYDMAVMIYCDYGALSTADRGTIMRVANAHLRPGGRFLLDVSSAYAYRSYQESNSWYTCQKDGYWSAQPHIVMEYEERFCENVTLHQANILTDEGLRIYYIWHTYFTPESFAKEAEAAGFKVLGCWGDIAGADNTETSQTLSFLMEKK